MYIDGIRKDIQKKNPPPWRKTGFSFSRDLFLFVCNPMLFQLCTGRPPGDLIPAAGVIIFIEHLIHIADDTVGFIFIFSELRQFQYPGGQLILPRVKPSLTLNIL